MEVKMRRYIIIIINIIICLSLVSCTAYWKEPLPNSGIWFCQELDMYIDFGLMQKQGDGIDCVKQYDVESQEYVSLSFSTDFGGNKIYIRDHNSSGTMILNGYYHYDNEKFLINPFYENEQLTDTKKEYLFLKTDFYPKDGIFYCKELKMEINFAQIENTPYCVYWYKDSGEIETLQVRITPKGKDLIILSEDGFNSDVTILNGIYKWQDDEFRIDSTYSTIFENKTYVFVKHSNTD